MQTIDTNKALFDADAIEARIVEAVDHYERSAPTVANWLNDLYERLGECTDTVILSELKFLERLKECGEWFHPNMAANQLYHMQERLGRDVTGDAGF